MLKNLKEPMITLDVLSHSMFTFYLTGSRFFGTYKVGSDWDFYTQDNADVRDYLKNIGFSIHNPAFVEAEGTYENDPNICEVFSRGFATMVQIQLVKDVDLKTRAQSMLNYLPGSMKQAFLVASEAKDAKDWWKWAHNHCSSPTSQVVKDASWWKWAYNNYSLNGDLVAWVRERHKFTPNTSRELVEEVIRKLESTLNNPASNRVQAIKYVRDYFGLDLKNSMDTVDFIKEKLGKNVGIFKCTLCHHEWEELKFKPPINCSWCGAVGKLIGDAYSERKK